MDASGSFGVRRWRDLMAEASAVLPVHEARRIVERVSGYDGSELVVAFDEAAPARVLDFFAGLVERRVGGEPLQYVVGRWGFRRLDLLVDRRVLIPRPETEQVVEVALAELARIEPGKHPVLVDLGTGSGAIALSLAVEVPGAQVHATDRSPDALAVAGANLAGVGGYAATRVRLCEGSWFEALPAGLAGWVHLIVSNPPYIAEHEVAGLDPEVVSWEPLGALVAGATGMEDVATIIAGAAAWLTRPGALVVELAPHQAEEAVALALAPGTGFVHAEIRPDLAGRPRALVARTPPEAACR